MYLEKLRLDGRVALVTGAGQGIGAACARALGEAGATVVVTDLELERAETVAAGLSDLGIEAAALTMDVTRSEEVEAVAAKVGMDQL